MLFEPSCASAAEKMPGALRQLLRRDVFFVCAIIRLRMLDFAGLVVEAKGLDITTRLWPSLL
ncbi:MAG: hypothetical protein ACREO5_11985, partial [Candidatus Binatia bacterium]